MTNIVARGMSITETPYKESEKVLYKNDTDNKIFTIEKHENGFFILHEYIWYHDERYKSSIPGTWYEKGFYLKPEELKGLTDGLVKESHAR